MSDYPFASRRSPTYYLLLTTYYLLLTTYSLLLTTYYLLLTTYYLLLTTYYLLRSPPVAVCKGAVVGITCSTGSFCPRGSTVPSHCPAGRYTNKEGLSAADQCSLAPPGLSSIAGSISPQRCLPGTFSDHHGHLKCEGCAAGSFQDIGGATACKVAANLAHWRRTALAWSAA